MDQGLIRFLCRAKEKTPHLLDIVQHGWMHSNHSILPSIKYEFGASRDYASQKTDIEQGLKKMRLAFGKYWTPAFVPPYHGYNDQTLKVLGGNEFKIFSAGTVRSKFKKNFIEMPTQVSFSQYENGKKSIYPAKLVLANLLKSIRYRPLSGILTHHKDFSNALYRRELIRFLDYVTAIRTKEAWRVLLFSEILSKTQGE